MTMVFLTDMSVVFLFNSFQIDGNYLILVEYQFFHKYNKYHNIISKYLYYLLLPKSFFRDDRMTSQCEDIINNLFATLTLYMMLTVPTYAVVFLNRSVVRNVLLKMLLTRDCWPLFKTKSPSPVRISLICLFSGILY